MKTEMSKHPQRTHVLHNVSQGTRFGRKTPRMQVSKELYSLEDFVRNIGHALFQICHNLFKHLTYTK